MIWRGFYDELLDDGGSEGVDLSPKTVRNTRVVLRTAPAAERLGLIRRNVAASARAPSATRPEFTTWSSDDLKEYFAPTAGHRLYVAFVVLAATGMRRSEVLVCGGATSTSTAGSLLSCSLCPPSTASR